MTNPITGAAQYNSAYLAEQAFKNLKVTSRVYAPFFSDHMRMVDSTHAIVKWADKVKPASVATLGSSYTAGAGTMTFAAHSIVKDYRNNLIPQVTEIQTANGGARYSLTAYNPTTRVATISFLGGTDSNLASGTEVKLLRVSGMGDKPISHNDAASFGGGDYNYWSYFNYNFEVADDMKNGKYKIDINEFTIDHQLEMNMDDAYANFEFKSFNDPRVAGTGATGRIPDGTNQGGYLSRAGGIITLGRARGMYEVDSSNAALSLNMLRTDIRQLRLNHAFNAPNAIGRETGIKVINGYCDKSLYPEVGKLAELQGHASALFGENEKLDGVLGVSCHKILVDDVIIAFKETDGLGNRSLFYETHPEDININVLHFMNTIDLAKDAATTRVMAENAFTTEFSCPWRAGLRTNIGSI